MPFRLTCPAQCRYMGALEHQRGFGTSGLFEGIVVVGMGDAWQSNRCRYGHCCHFYEFTWFYWYNACLASLSNSPTPPPPPSSSTCFFFFFPCFFFFFFLLLPSSICAFLFALFLFHSSSFNSSCSSLYSSSFSALLRLLPSGRSA